MMSLRILRALAGALLVVAVWLPGRGHADTAYLPAAEAFALRIVQPTRPGGPVGLHWTIASGYYLYRDRMAVSARPAGAPLDVVRPASERKDDPSFGSVDVYHDQVTFQVQAGTAKTLAVTWQGCAEAGLCYPPQSQDVTIQGTASEPVAASSDASPAIRTAWGQATSGSDGDIQAILQRHSLAWTLPLFFALGIALAFTPCVLPMVPILSTLVVGHRAGPRRALAMSAAFVLPMALTYAGLGVAAALAGANLQALLQSRGALLGLSAIFVALASSMFGLVTLQLPNFLRSRLDGASRAQQGGTLAGAAAMGLVSALLVGPCMTAPLAGALLYIAQSGNAVQGALLLLALGLGMGAPLLVVGTLGAKYLPKPGPWMDLVKGAFGFLLLAMAVWTVQRVLPESAALALWGVLVVTAAIAVFQSARAHGPASPQIPHRGRIVAPAAALTLGLWGSAMVLGAAAGSGNPWKPLGFASKSASPGDPARRAVRTEQFEPIGSSNELKARLDEASALGRPVLVDFYADWCVSCMSIDKEVFGDPLVQRALKGVILLRADVTASTRTQLALMHDHQVLGPPTVMLFDAHGRERRDARLVGEFESADLLKRSPAAGAAL